MRQRGKSLKVVVDWRSLRERINRLPGNQEDRESERQNLVHSAAAGDPRHLTRQVLGDRVRNPFGRSRVGQLPARGHRHRRFGPDHLLWFPGSVESQLLPINREWVSPSLVWGEVALCRDEDGSLWLCQMQSEAEGWEKIQPADETIIKAFQWTQALAGKEPQPSPLLSR